MREQKKNSIDTTVRHDNYNIWLHGTDTQYGDFSGYDVTSCVCLEVKEKLAHVS